MRVVALEEHFWTPGLAAVAGMDLVAPQGGPRDRQLRDLGACRLADMDAAGIDLQVISHCAPGAQHLPPAEAFERAMEAYDVLAPAVTTLLSTSAWGWHAETGLHVLRMVVGGVFDRYPGLRLVIGHGGEMLPFMLDRIDRVLTSEVTGLPWPPSRYLLNN